VVVQKASGVDTVALVSVFVIFPAFCTCVFGATASV
jgi:hypothetical protein